MCIALAVVLCSAPVVSIAAAQQVSVRETLFRESALPARVPIHRLAVDPTFGELGIWAAGRDYKMSFHDGPTFVPVLGRDAPHNLPVQWRTTRVALGSRALGDRFDYPATMRTSDWRCEYHHPGGVVEAYDVLERGVEQTFTIERPAGDVDCELTVEGQWLSELTPSLVPSEDGSGASLDFVDSSGRTRVRCGKAIAIDASGRRTPVRTELEGAVSRLCVPADFVRDAWWPITIDPLVQTVSLILGQHVATECEVSHADTTSTAFLVTQTYATSAADEDIQMWLVSRAGDQRWLVFADVSTSVSSSGARAAFVRNAGLSGMWTIAFARASATVAQLRVQVVPDGATSFPSGSTLAMPSLSGLAYRNPDVGGSTLGGRALIVYQTDTTPALANTRTTEVRYTLLDPDAPTAPFQGDGIVASSPALAVDRESPSVTANATGSADWMVCWQERGSLFALGDWRIRARRVTDSGPFAAEATVATSPHALAPQLTRPSIDGGDGRYCVAALRSGAEPPGNAIVVRRFDWPTGAIAPTLSWTSTIASSLVLVLHEPSIAFDTITRSHWGVAYDRATTSTEFAVVGYDGSVRHTWTTAWNQPVAPVVGVAFDRTLGRFCLAYQPRVGQWTATYASLWEYPASAAVGYGVGCGGAFGATDVPIAGSQFWTTSKLGIPPSAPCALLVSPTASALALDTIGATGCALLVGPNPVLTVPTIATPSGRAQLEIPLGDAMTFHMQWAWLQGGANPLGVVLSNGQRVDVR